MTRSVVLRRYTRPICRVEVDTATGRARRSWRATSSKEPATGVADRCMGRWTLLYLDPADRCLYLQRGRRRWHVAEAAACSYRSIGFASRIKITLADGTTRVIYNGTPGRVLGALLDITSWDAADDDCSDLLRLLNNGITSDAWLAAVPSMWLEGG